MHSKCLTACLLFIIVISFSAGAQTFGQADSLFAIGEYAKAKTIYDRLLTDTAHNSIAWNRLGYSNYKLGKVADAIKAYKKSAENNPPKGLQPTLYSRMATAYAGSNDKQNAVIYLEKAVNAGYLNFEDLDTLKAFAGLQQDEQFKKQRDKAFYAAFPCMADTLSRQFDFWMGEWDAYVTGTPFLAGHSIIQRVSGGCMILENWTSANTPYSGKSMNFVDAATHKWQQVWVGSEGGGQHVFINGEYRDGAMRFDFEQTTAQGKKQIGHFIFYNQGPNQVRQFNETSDDNGATWTTVYDFTYKRKKQG